MEEPKEMQNETMEPLNTQSEPEATLSEQTPDPLAASPAETNEAQPVDTAAESTDVQPAANNEQATAESNGETAAEQDEPATDDEHAAEPEVEEEPTVDYSAASREELIEALKELLQTDDITKIKNRVGAIKIRFAEVDREAKKAAFDKFIEEGGNKD